MHDADAIEAINFEQLATATDRLLVLGLRVSRRRPSVPSLVSSANAAVRVRGSRPAIASAAAVARARAARRQAAALAQQAAEPTVFVRTPRRQALTERVVVPVLIGIALGLVAML